MIQKYCPRFQGSSKRDLKRYKVAVVLGYYQEIELHNNEIIALKLN